MSLYLDPTKRHDFVLLFDVTNGNPNGDPDAGNMPRIDPETNHGFVTDVAIKRKVRNYAVMAYGEEVYIQSKVALNTLYEQAMGARGLGYPQVSIGDEELIEWIRDKGTAMFEFDPEAQSVKIARKFADSTGINGVVAYLEENFKNVAKKLKGRIDAVVGKLSKEDEVLLYDEELHNWLKNDPPPSMEYDTYSKTVKYVHEIENKSKDEILNRLKDEGVEIPEHLEKKIDWLAKELVAVAKKGAKKLDRDTRDLIKEDMVRKYYDIRMFGAVLTAGTNAGQVRGPVQFTFSRSISPILPLDISITRIAITKESDHRDKQTEMGRKAIIPYGLYLMHGFFNPKLAANLTAKGNPVSENDMQILWDSLQNMFELDRSAARGEMVCRGLYVFSHKDEKGLGNAPAHKLFDLIHVEEKDPSRPVRFFTDYEVKVDFDHDEWADKVKLKEFR